MAALKKDINKKIYIDNVGSLIINAHSKAWVTF